MRFNRLILVISGLLLAISLASPAFSLANDSSRFLLGDWSLVQEESDDLNKELQKAMTYIDASQLRIINSAISGPRIVGNIKRRPTPRQIERVSYLFDSVVPFSPIARIEAKESQLKIYYADGRHREIFTDARGLENSVQTTSATRPQKLVFASWEADEFVIETISNTGISVVERYKWNAIVKALTAQISVESNQVPGVLTVVYHYKPSDIK